MNHTPDKAVFDELLKQLAGKLDGYQAILSKIKYLAGNVRVMDCLLRTATNESDCCGSSFASVADHACGLFPSPLC
jgi:hypothetical protein